MPARRVREAELPVTASAGPITPLSSAPRPRSAREETPTTTRWPKRGSDFQERTRRRAPLPSYEHAEHEALKWISFYNGERLHEEFGDLPSAEYEELNTKTDNTLTRSAK